MFRLGSYKITQSHQILFVALNIETSVKSVWMGLHKPSLAENNQFFTYISSSFSVFGIKYRFGDVLLLLRSDW